MPHARPGVDTGPILGYSYKSRVNVSQTMKFLQSILRNRICPALFFVALLSASAADSPITQPCQLSRAEYLDRIQAAWTAQIVACMMGFQFEHKVASTQWVTNYPQPVESAVVDDDWYYEMAALRAFEKYGPGLTVQQLGRQWQENSCGSWGSSEQARLNLQKGIHAPDCGHPRYNKLWFTIGPQFSAELYGLLAPGMPNLAARLARELGHVNGYAEAVDGAVFMAGMVSLGFVENNPQVIVTKATRLIHPDSPYRQCLDHVIALARTGHTPHQIAAAVEDRWRLEYPASNNAVANGGIVAAALWFGQADFLRTVNIVYQAADFTDADCNAANAAAVIGAMHGMKSLPPHLVEALHDRIAGKKMGGVNLTPAVDEKISELAKRTAMIGEKLLSQSGAKISENQISITSQEPQTQPAELFQPADLMKFWDSSWQLERAGLGGGGGGVANIRGNTHLEGPVLATWPRDPVRGVVLRRTLKISTPAVLTFEAGVDAGRTWDLEIYAGNKSLLHQRIDGGSEPIGGRKWQKIQVDLNQFSGQTLQLRLYQRVLLADKIPGNAYWKDLQPK